MTAKLNEEKKSFKELESIFIEKVGGKFQDYYDKYYNKVLIYIKNMCHDTQMSEDIATDAFLVALEKIYQFDNSKSQFSTWLFAIAKNLMLMKLNERNKNISMDVELDENGGTLKDFLAQEADTPMNKGIDLIQIKFDIMMKHIFELKPKYKEIIEMREIHNMSYDKISQELNICLSTTKSRIRTARQTLIALTKDEFKKLDELYLEAV